jgi:hypothetical protein
MDIQGQINTEEDTELCRIMREVGSDAAGPFHNYTKLYSTIFEPVRQAPLRILEVGLAPNPDIGDAEPAAAVRGWRRYFPNATVVGADPSETYAVPVEGVSTYAYTWDLSGIASIFEHEDTREPFDIVIFDVVTNAPNKAAHFEEFVKHVRIGGVIIVEDIFWRDSLFWMDQKQKWDKAYPHFSWRPISIPCRTHRGDNILMIAQVHESADAAKAAMPVNASTVPAPAVNEASQSEDAASNEVVGE